MLQLERRTASHEQKSRLIWACSAAKRFGDVRADRVSGADHLDATGPEIGGTQTLDVVPDLIRKRTGAPIDIEFLESVGVHTSVSPRGWVLVPRASHQSLVTSHSYRGRI